VPAGWLLHGWPIVVARNDACILHWNQWDSVGIGGLTEQEDCHVIRRV
jgi:hypothetical protein